MEPRLHTATAVPATRAFEAFRAACEGGGTPPDWTQGSADPATWTAPSDAAGGLILWREDGELDRIEPAPAGDAQAIADDVIADLVATGLTWDVMPGVIRATYASCGGRIVALIQQDDEGWWVCVFRSFGSPRSGCSEANIHTLLGDSEWNTLIVGSDGYLGRAAVEQAAMC